MLNNLHDQQYLTQFPGPMAIVATGSTTLAKDVALATGLELKAVGINWILGPVLDVLTNSANRLLGVRTMGDDPQEVTNYGLAFLEGYASAGISTCGKHFPGYGNATVDSMLGLPVVSDSMEQLETASLIPFRAAIRVGIDSVMVGGCALPKIATNEMHACLSERVVNDLLRQEMGLEGVIVSECLELDALYENVGVRQGTVMAAMAGCDIILVCSSHRLQREAISGIFGAVNSGIMDQESIFLAARRVSKMKSRHLSWAEALNPKSLSYLAELKQKHTPLAETAYRQSITLLRDHAKFLPLTQSVEPDGDILLLTPLVTPTVFTLHTSAMKHLLLGEDIFQEFGRYLAKIHTGKVLHASYTANGLLGLHDSLIERSRAVIVVTTDAIRNMYQVGFAKHLAIVCSQQRKPLIAVAASSPYDLALDRIIGTYICLYEFTFPALETCADLLFGNLTAKGKFPGSGMYQRSRSDHELSSGKRSRNRWLVEKWNVERDLKKLKTLWENCFPDRRLGRALDGLRILVSSKSTQCHFIVRNSSTNNLYGFCATWVYEKPKIGCIVAIFVEPSRRGMSIGKSLHDRAIKYLVQERQVRTLKIGSIMPSFFEGIPLEDSGLSRDLAKYADDSTAYSGDLTQWFRGAGWDIPQDGENDTSSLMLLTSVQDWLPSQTLIHELETTGVKFDGGMQPNRKEEVLRLVRARYASVAGMPELYEELDAAGQGRIVVALDPVKNKVMASIILFTRGSGIAQYMPWMLEFDDARVGGLCGLAWDSTYGKEMLKVALMGLVACGIRQFKMQGFDRCVIDGVEGDQEAICIASGFEFWRRYRQVTVNV